jgi:SAM-dependent methyltransferase
MLERVVVRQEVIRNRSKPSRALRNRNERSWSEYWDHLENGDWLFSEQSDEYVTRLLAAVAVHSRTRVLDFGCGYGFVACALAPRVGSVAVWDASPRMRSRASATLRPHANARLIDLSQATPAERFDLILVNSVAQYMTSAEFDVWLERWHDLLAESGTLVLSDLLPPAHGTWVDVVDILSFSSRHRILLRTLREATVEVRRYWRTRAVQPLVRIHPDDLCRRAGVAGFDVAFMKRNLTHLTHRTTALLTVNGPAPGITNTGLLTPASEFEPRPQTSVVRDASE